MNRREFGQFIMAMTLEQAFVRVGAQVPGSKQTPGSQIAAPRFSCEIAMLKLSSFDRCIEVVAEAGYQGVELTGYFQNWTPQERSRLLVRMKSLHVMIDMLSGLQASFAVPDQTEEFLSRVDKHCHFAKDLECPQINIKSGKRLSGTAANVQFAAAVGNLKHASDVAAKNGINIVIEKLEKNIDWVGLVHIADVPGRHEPGTGEIDYTNIYRSLGKLHYNRFIAMEYAPTVDPVTSLRKSRMEAQQAMAEGQQIVQ